MSLNTFANYCIAEVDCVFYHSLLAYFQEYAICWLESTLVNLSTSGILLKVVMIISKLYVNGCSNGTGSLY